jgi:hypothetical protein
VECEILSLQGVVIAKFHDRWCAMFQNQWFLKNQEMPWYFKRFFWGILMSLINQLLWLIKKKTDSILTLIPSIAISNKLDSLNGPNV